MITYRNGKNLRKRHRNEREGKEGWQEGKEVEKNNNQKDNQQKRMRTKRKRARKERGKRWKNEEQDNKKK
jgi:hypothetical protein